MRDTGKVAGRRPAVSAPVVILAGIAVLLAGIATFTYASGVSGVAVIDSPIWDEDVRGGIVERITKEGVKARVSSAGIVRVADEATAMRVGTILLIEDLIPHETDPGAVFDMRRRITAELERNERLRFSHTMMLTDHIRAIDGVDNAEVKIVWPEYTLFRFGQDSVTASVIVYPSPESGIAGDRRSIEGIERLLQVAVDGLLPGNIVVTDQNGMILNDFHEFAEPTGSLNSTFFRCYTGAFNDFHGLAEPDET